MTFKKIKVDQMLNTAKDGLAVLVEHESTAFDNLVASLRERVSVARKARNVGELLRNQLDLLPDTHARLVRDHAVRGQLLKGFGRDIRGSLKLKRAT